MHVHGATFNPNLQLNAAASAARAEARREVERTRKKLLSASSLLGASDDEDCVVTLNAGQDHEEQGRSQDHRRHHVETQSIGKNDGENDDTPFSDYA